MNWLWGGTSSSTPDSSGNDKHSNDIGSQPAADGHEQSHLELLGGGDHTASAGPPPLMLDQMKLAGVPLKAQMSPYLQVNSFPLLSNINNFRLIRPSSVKLNLKSFFRKAMKVAVGNSNSTWAILAVRLVALTWPEVCAEHSVNWEMSKPRNCFRTQRFF